MFGWCHVLRACASAVAIFYGASSPAQSFITGIPPSGLRLYTEVDGAKKPAGDLKSADVTLPLQLIEEEGDFGRVNVPNKGALWVDLRRAQVKRGVVAECAPPAKGLAQTRTQVATAGTRGASDACPR